MEVKHGRKIVSLRSPLRLHNHLTVPIEICCLSKDLEKYNTESVGGKIKGAHTQIKVVEPGQIYDVPLFVAYHCKLYVAPTQNG